MSAVMVIIDLILTDDGKPYVLEVNGTPGMSRDSNFAVGATMAGLTHTDVVLAMLHEALARPPRVCATAKSAAAPAIRSSSSVRSCAADALARASSSRASWAFRVVTASSRRANSRPALIDSLFTGARLKPTRHPTTPRGDQ
ncbi:hypothetical protein [Streptomyces sp. 8ZJF_21]|uniref:hypothetical protein n=1 Tax=Streptomyces sp. 8ZJF_21 TaxID=2903141 RepID=UPI001E34F35F|nr:hypothetical protein [Streptomyces sp. 8ZJF_21]MCD9592987.1 hypothetical protein [Streptomyces sp. 8ZJF_21]